MNCKFLRNHLQEFHRKYIVWKICKIFNMHSLFLVSLFLPIYITVYSLQVAIWYKKVHWYKNLKYLHSFKQQWKMPFEMQNRLSIHASSNCKAFLGIFSALLWYIFKNDIYPLMSEIEENFTVSAGYSGDLSLKVQESSNRSRFWHWRIGMIDASRIHREVAAGDRRHRAIFREKRGKTLWFRRNTSPSKIILSQS